MPQNSRRTLSGFKGALWSQSAAQVREPALKLSKPEFVEMQDGKLWQYIVIIVGLAAIAFVVYKVATGGLG
ncbi:MAG: hypothetical protein HZC36_06195 [Armatimonadetes bacterium]|nr:hypothetical protein [Armatimonadota bacterium]